MFKVASALRWPLWRSSKQHCEALLCHSQVKAARGAPWRCWRALLHAAAETPAVSAPTTLRWSARFSHGVQDLSRLNSAIAPSAARRPAPSKFRRSVAEMVGGDVLHVSYKRF